MPSGAVIQAKIAKVLTKVGATYRVVTFRDSHPVGGNALLGVGQTTITNDVAIDPQPAVETLSVEEVASGGALLQLGDYRFVFSGTVPEAQIKTSNIVYGSDILKIVSYKPAVLFGTVIAWEVIARTIKAA